MTKKGSGKSRSNSWHDDPGTGSSGGSSYKPTPRCYESHPPYEVAPGILIYGGSCHYPIVKDADIYGGFDSGMRFQGGSQYPWAGGEGPIEFLFKITDMQAPTDEVEFRKMIEWLTEQLTAGKKVHLGCIGGHGRTGLVFSALHKHMTGDEDATTHVRTHYCKKTVESDTQVKWLQKHWGITPVEPTKAYSYGSSSKSSSSSGSQKTLSLGGGSSGTVVKLPLPEKTNYHQDSYKKPQSTGLPLYSAASIWG